MVDMRPRTQPVKQKRIHRQETHRPAVSLRAVPSQPHHAAGGGHARGVIPRSGEKPLPVHPGVQLLLHVLAAHIRVDHQAIKNAAVFVKRRHRFADRRNAQRLHMRAGGSRAYLADDLHRRLHYGIGVQLLSAVRRGQARILAVGLRKDLAVMCNERRLAAGGPDIHADHCHISTPHKAAVFSFRILIPNQSQVVCRFCRIISQ